jgi:NSS family neurotransmitter:Na+ symporter
MKGVLVDKRVKNDTAERLQSIRAQATKSVWRAQARFQAALEEAGEGAEEARAILLEDPELAAAVQQVGAIEERVAAVKAEASAGARAEVDAMSDKQVRDEAEILERRRRVGEKVSSTFVGLAKDGWTSIFWAALFMMITVLIVAGGISGGIERWCKVLMPALIALILVMVVYGAFTRGFPHALRFVFMPDASKLKPSGVLEALGHAFFTLSLGMGAMITYGSYQKEKERLATQTVLIAGLDTLVALLACLMMFPIVFSYDQPASAGPGLVFISMPLAFAELGTGGMLLSIVFFGLLVFAALTSSVSLLEVVASYFIDEKGWSRRRAAWTLGSIIFLFGVPSAFAMDDGGLFKSWEPGYGKNFFDTADYLASNWMLPLGGLLISVYAGWVMPEKLRQAELDTTSAAVARGWLLLVRFVAPVLVVLVLLQKVGFIDIG